MCQSFDRGNVSASTLARPESRSAMHAGSCTVWSTESSLTGRCRPTRLLGAGTTPSIRSSAKRGRENMFPGPCLSIWSLLLLVSNDRNGSTKLNSSIYDPVASSDHNCDGIGHGAT